MWWIITALAFGSAALYRSGQHNFMWGTSGGTKYFYAGNEYNAGEFLGRYGTFTVPPSLACAFPPVDCAVVNDLAVAALKSGASIPLVLESLDLALSEEEEKSGLAHVAHCLVMGSSWEEAWADTPERFNLLRDALEPAWIDGVAAIALLEGSSSIFRAGRTQRSKEAAAKLGAKLVLPLGLCFLPAFILLGVVPVVASAGVSLFGG